MYSIAERLYEHRDPWDCPRCGEQEPCQCEKYHGDYPEVCRSCGATRGQHLVAGPLLCPLTDPLDNL